MSVDGIVWFDTNSSKRYHGNLSMGLAYRIFVVELDGQRYCNRCVLHCIFSGRHLSLKLLEHPESEYYQNFLVHKTGLVGTYLCSITITAVVDCRWTTSPQDSGCYKQYRYLDNVQSSPVSVNKMCLLVVNASRVTFSLKLAACCFCLVV